MATAAAKPLVVPAELTIKNSAAFLKKLQQLRKRRAKKVAIDLAPLVRIDSAGIQLLAAARNSLGDRLDWIGASAALEQASQQLGLVDVLLLDPAAEPENPVAETAEDDDDGLLPVF